MLYLRTCGQQQTCHANSAHHQYAKYKLNRFPFSGSGNKWCKMYIFLSYLSYIFSNQQSQPFWQMIQGDVEKLKVPKGFTSHGLTYTLYQGFPNDNHFRKHLERFVWVCTGNCSFCKMFYCGQNPRRVAKQLVIWFEMYYNINHFILW